MGVAHVSDKTPPHVIGVLQLLKKRNRSAASDNAVVRSAGSGCELDEPQQRRQQMKTVEETFTSQDEDFFQELLKILGLAAYRAMQVQACVHSLENQKLNIGRLFEL